MLRTEVTVLIQASPERVWDAVSNVEDMPNWTSSMTSVRVDSPGVMGVGATARIKQPKLGTLRWRVTDWAPGRSFVWVARRGGVAAVAGHEIEPTEQGVRLTLSVEQSGLLARPAAALTGRLTRRYLTLEADGIKKASEADSTR
ncbi:MAG TPA: SRPBCC family protein [Actinocrinis sp.]